ncbi:MAG: hypothetical protein HYZ57_05310 [Acidobacteria bacterium]|nr:hypothetical protein [Acidobacteriota bacterium]
MKLARDTPTLRTDTLATGRHSQGRPEVRLLCAAALLCSAPGLDAADRAVFTARFEIVNRPAGSVSRQPVKGRYLEAVRSDGSRVQRNLNGPGDSVSERDVATITLLPVDQRVLVDYAVHMKSTYPLKPGSSSRAWFPTDPLCHDVYPPGSYSLVPYGYLGAEELSGIETRKYTLEDSRMRTTQFRAPALNCFAIKSVTEFKGADGHVEQTATQEAKVIMGPPDERLFEIPPDFKEGKPSDLQRARMRREGKGESIPPSLLKTWERQDAAYLRARSPE